MTDAERIRRMEALLVRLTRHCNRSPSFEFFKNEARTLLKECGLGPHRATPARAGEVEAA